MMYVAKVTTNWDNLRKSRFYFFSNFSRPDVIRNPRKVFQKLELIELRLVKVNIDTRNK